MNKQLLFGIVLLLASLGQVTADLYLPSLPAIAQGLSTSANWVQWSVSSYMVGFAFSQLFYGPISDGIGRKKPLIMGLIISLVGTMVCLSSPSVLWLIIGRFLQGAGAGSEVSLSRSILRDVFSGTDLARYNSYLAAGSIGFMASAPLVGGLIQENLNWRANFVALGIYSGIILVLTLVKLPETNVNPSRHHLSLKQWFANLTSLYKHRVYRWQSVIIFVTYGGILAWLTAGPLLLQVNMGLSPIDFGWVALLTGIAYGISSFLNGRMVGTFGIKPMVTIGLVMISIGACLLVFSCFLAGAITLWLLITPIIFFIGGTGFVFANAYALALQPFPNIAGIAGSIFGFMQIFGGAIASGVLAYWHDESQLPLTIILAFCAVIAIFAFVKTLGSE